MSTAPETNKEKRRENAIAALQASRRRKLEQDARDALARMNQRADDERFDFAYDPFTSTLRYRIRIDQGNDTNWQQAYATAQRIAEHHHAQVQNVRWGKDFWMTELTEVVARPQ